MLQYDDNQMSEFRGYDLVHHDDLSYVASAHAECKYILNLQEIYLSKSIKYIHNRNM